jgi:uncharacterized NAD(P)/FAD-binding protein YdhS
VTRIAIVGAGLSGRLLALNLLQHASPATSISLIDRGDARWMGPAYSEDADFLLLNVPAGRMGAYSADPEHFLKWLRERGLRAGPLDFVARSLYREYILGLLDREAHRSDAGSFDHISDEVTGLETTQQGVTIHMKRGDVQADKVVLALGNFPPRHPSIEHTSALASSRYVQNPWRLRILDVATNEDTVCLIGTGQTTVDLAVALHKRGHQGRIVAISRHGLLPLAHGGFEPYPSFFDEIKASKRVREIFRIVRKHVALAKRIGLDERSVIDSLRADTQALWLGLNTEEKLRFLRHLFRYWEVVRSRIPRQNQAIVNAMQASGQLEVVAGRIRDLVDTDAAIDVRYTPRGRSADKTEKVALVANCIGPESDYRRIPHPLVRNLLANGHIRPGPAFLGIDARTDGALIGRDGRASDVFYTLGSTMRGVLWEILAVVEIRVQAERLACTLIQSGA